MLRTTSKRLYKKLLHQAGEKKIFTFISSVLHNSEQSVEKYILHLIQTDKLDPKWLINFSHKVSGIGDYGNEEHTGELYLLRKILPRFITNSSPVIFDVGANVGNYSTLIYNEIKDAEIFAFEPNPFVFAELEHRLIGKINTYNTALGKEVSSTKIYTYADSLEGSEHATMYEKVFTELYNRTEAMSYDIDVNTLDAFCSKKGISEIDFLKIDTEGHEHEVLLGSVEMLAAGKIKAIQFELNKMNVISRVFLKDFYDLCGSRYSFFRLKKDGLINLGSYDTINEIFNFQNIVMIKTDIIKDLSKLSNK